MKQIIKDVLNIHGEMNSNLASDAARDVIAIEIIEKLKKKGFYTEYRKDELEEREGKKGLIFQSCGKSTFETEYDYLVHPKLHLGCALKEEMKGKDIKEQYHEASAEYYKDKKGMKPLDWWKKDNPALKSILNNRIESVEEIEAWNREVEACSTQQSYDTYRKKLSEEIVDNKDVKYIYESPDGGKTIYRREVGSNEKVIESRVPGE